MSCRPCGAKCPCKLFGTTLTDVGTQCDEGLLQCPVEHVGSSVRPDGTSDPTATAGGKQAALFEGWSLVELREAQLADGNLRPIMRCQEGQDVRPLHADIAMWSAVSKRYLSEWDRLYIDEGVLCCKFYSTDGRHSWHQILLPYALCEDVLVQLHDSPTGGILGLSVLTRSWQLAFTGRKCASA